MTRFIDTSPHAGCSRKLPALDLSELLGLIGIDGVHSDSAKVRVDGSDLYSTVDIIYPNVDNPDIFGRVAAEHVLNDLYAVGASPLSMTVVLSLKDYWQMRDKYTQMLGGFVNQARAAGCEITGGHTLNSDEAYIGGCAMGKGSLSPSANFAHGKYSLFLSKCLGGSIATVLWKKGAALVNHSDVVAGMLESNSFIIEHFPNGIVKGATDISGFGLLNHIGNLATRLNLSIEIDVSCLPVYNSVSTFAKYDAVSSMYDSNRVYFQKKFGVGTRHLDMLQEIVLFDACVSGPMAYVSTAKIREQDYKIGEVVGYGGEPALRLR